MLLIFGIIIYVAVLGAFASFGRFMKDCDETMYELIKNESLNRG